MKLSFQRFSLLTALELSLLICTAVLLFQMISVSINFIPVSSSLDAWIPVTYWLILGCATVILVLALVYYPSHIIGFLSTLLLVAIMFPGIELSEVNVRASDTYGFLWGSNFVGAVLPNAYTVGHTTIPYYQNWPGFFWFEHVFYTVTSIGELETAKLLTVFFPFVFLLLFFAVGKQIFHDLRGATLFSVVGTAFLPWVAVDAAPQVLGAVFLLLAVYSWRERQRTNSSILFVMIFLSVTLTHGIDAFEILFVILSAYVLLRAWGFVRSRHPPAGPTTFQERNWINRIAIINPLDLLIISGLVFGIWAINSLFVQASLGGFVQQLFGLGTVPVTFQFGYLTQYRLPSVISAGLYMMCLGVLISCTIVFARRARSRELYAGFLLAVIAAGLVYFFPYVYADLADREIEGVFPFLAWAITAVISSSRLDRNRRSVGIVLIAFLLLSGVVYFYSHEAVLVYPTSTNSGDFFFTEHMDANLTLGYFSAAPAPWTLPPMRTDIPVWFTISQTTPNPVAYYNQSDVIIYSPTVVNALLYFSGTNSLASYLNMTEHNVVYASSEYAILVLP